MISAQSGYSDALVRLIETMRTWMFSIAYHSTRNYADAQDAVANTTVQIYKHIGDLKNPQSVRAWIRQILINEIRRASSTAHSPLPEDLPDNTPPDISLTVDIQHALNRLPYDQSRAVSLFYLAGVSINEIARRLQRPPGTIKRWLHLGRRRLAHELEDYAMQDSHSAAVLLSTDLEPKMLDEVLESLRDAGYSPVKRLGALPPLDKTGDGNSTEFHLPKEISNARFILIDEMVVGRSAFELHAILKAAAESKETAFGILLDSPSENTIFAAWAAGFDLCLDKQQMTMDELKRLSAKLK